jgi:TPR repeat protein
VSISTSGIVCGTFGYMPPEQMKDAGDVGPEADVFALGAILYECLAGRPAFVATTRGEVQERIAAGAVEPLVAARPDAPRWLAAVVERAIAPMISHRFANGAALLEALSSPPRKRSSFAPLALLVAALPAAGLAVLALRGGETPLGVRIEAPSEGFETKEDSVQVVAVASGAAAVQVVVACGARELASAASLDDRGRLATKVRLPEGEGAVALEVRARDARGSETRARVTIIRRPRTEGDLARARRRAAEAGDAGAMVELALMLAAGRGVAKDAAEAYRWNRKAAEAGSAEGMYQVGTALRQGAGVPRDEAEAVRWFRKAVETGGTHGMTDLGVAFAEGRGVTKDEAEAVRWFRKAAEAGDAIGMSNLGAMFTEGRGVATSAAESYSWFRKAAEAGDPLSMTNVGTALAQGRGVAKDEVEAARWYRKAAEAGDTEGMSNLGAVLMEGRGAAKDEAEAVRWFRKAAEAGAWSGAHNLAAALELGRGTTKDEAEAFRWYRKAAEAGQTMDMNRVGAMLMAGQGVARDEVEAVLWFRKAAALGDADAREALRSLGAE